MFRESIVVDQNPTQPGWYAAKYHDRRKGMTVIQLSENGQMLNEEGQAIGHASHFTDWFRWYVRFDCCTVSRQEICQMLSRAYTAQGVLTTVNYSLINAMADELMKLFDNSNVLCLDTLLPKIKWLIAKDSQTTDMSFIGDVGFFIGAIEAAIEECLGRPFGDDESELANVVIIDDHEIAALRSLMGPQAVINDDRIDEVYDGDRERFRTMLKRLGFKLIQEPL